MLSTWKTPCQTPQYVYLAPIFGWSLLGGGVGEAPKHINFSTTSPHPPPLTQTATHRFRILGKTLNNRSLMSDRSPRVLRQNVAQNWISLTILYTCAYCRILLYLIVDSNSSCIEGSRAFLFFNHRKTTSIVQKLGSHRKPAHIVQKLGSHGNPLLL